MVLSQIRWVCMRSTLPSKFRYNVWKSWFVLIMKLDINFALVMLMSKGRSMSVYWSCCKVPESRSTGRFNFNEQRSHNSEYKITAMVRQRNVRWFLLEKDWKLDRQRLASIDQCSFRTWWSDLRTKWMYDVVRGGSEWWRSVADKHWKHGESRCCVYPLFRQSPQMQAQHHHVGGITPAPCARKKQRQVELLDNRAFSGNRLRARVRTIFSRYVSCYTNLKLTTLWPFVTSKNEKSNNSRDLSQCPRFAAPIQKRPKSRS